MSSPSGLPPCGAGWSFDREPRHPSSSGSGDGGVRPRRCRGGWTRCAAVLHLLGPATPKLVAGYLDAPVKDVTQHWPSDVVDVDVGVGEQSEVRTVLEKDANSLASPKAPDGLVRLLGPFDLFLQGRDRELVVPDGARRKELWRTLGRPGAVLSGHEIVGTWRPRAAGSKLRLAVDAWGTLPDLTEQAERLADFRGVEFAGFVDPD